MPVDSEDSMIMTLSDRDRHGDGLQIESCIWNVGSCYITCYIAGLLLSHIPVILYIISVCYRDITCYIGRYNGVLYNRVRYITYNAIRSLIQLGAEAF
jgi:hypothetical protein